MRALEVIIEILRTEHLYKTYGEGENAFNAVNDVSFSVEQGEFVAVVRASGSGKSTLMHLIGGRIAYRVFERNNPEIAYTFPWFAIILSIAAVMPLVWMIMRFSIAKVKKQNIIETIRKDTI